MPLASSAYKCTSTSCAGTTSAAVTYLKNLQTTLNKAGVTPPLVVDGLIGAKTVTAVVALAKAGRGGTTFRQLELVSPTKEVVTELAPELILELSAPPAPPQVPSPPPGPSPAPTGPTPTTINLPSWLRPILYPGQVPSTPAPAPGQVTVPTPSGYPAAPKPSGMPVWGWVAIGASALTLLTAVTIAVKRRS